MSEISDRVRRAFGDHGSFAPADDGAFESTTTAFDGRVGVAESGAEVTFEVTVRVPMLDAVVAGDVAEVVEEGWYETFALRVEDVGGVTKADRDLTASVRREGDEAVVETSFGDVNERRGVDDAAAVIDYVEGTYVQGIIPGYEYTEPVTNLIDRASEAAGGDGAPL
jgi:hypothetical protein